MFFSLPLGSFIVWYPASHTFQMRPKSLFFKAPASDDARGHIVFSVFRTWVPVYECMSFCTNVCTYVHTYVHR